jgi:molybdate transport repressor ModE-like protein
MQLKVKIWLEKDGHNVMGRGRYELLKAIGETGSLREASTQLGISYRHAWGHIKKLEQSAGFAFVDSKVGGRGGGASSLTPQALEFLKQFETLRHDIEEYARKSARNFIDA